MRTKIISILIMLFIGVTLMSSCNNEEEIITPNNMTQVKMVSDNEYAIQNFINQINGVETKALTSTNHTKDQVKMRMYATGGVDCFDGNGSCLPEVIVISDSRTVCNQTIMGSELQKLVNDNKVVLKKDFNATSNTEFYIYNSTGNNRTELVVPVAYRNK